MTGFLKIKNEFFRSGRAICGSVYLYAVSAPVSNGIAELSIGLMIIFWLVRMALNRRLIFYRDTVVYLLGGYLLVNLVSALVSAAPAESLSNFGQEWIVLMFIVLISNLDDFTPVRRALILFLSVSAGVAVYGVWQHFYGLDLWRGRIIHKYGEFFRAEGFFGLCLTYGGFMLMAFLTALGGFWGARDRKEKAWFSVTAGLLLLTVIASNSRSVWIGTAGGMLLLGLRLGIKRFIYSVAALVVIVRLLYAFDPGLIYSRSTQAMFDASKTMPRTNRIRVELWEKSLEIIKDNPFLGVGPGNLKHNYDRYGFSEESRGLRHSHNDILNMGVNSGIIGAVLFILIWLTVIKRGFSIHRLPALQGDILRFMALGATAAITGILTAGLFQCFYTDVETGMLWWFMAGIVVLTDKLAQKQVKPLS